MVEFGSEPTLRTYLAVLRRRKLWVISIALLGLAVSLAISLSEAKQYSATAQLLVQPSNETLALGSAQQQITPTDVQTELQLVTSAPVLMHVQRQLGSHPPISASEVAQTNVIALTATSSTPAEAALIANTYANAFVAHTRAASEANLTAAETQLKGQILALQKQVQSLRSSRGTSEATALLNEVAVLKEQLAQLEVNGAVASGGIEVVTPAQKPASPSSPQPSRDGVLGLVAGLVVGLAAAFVRDNLDDAVSSKEIAEQLVGVPVLAMVPMVPSWKKREQPMVISRSSPTSPAAEAYRSLRTSLQFTRNDRPLRTVLVTSPAAAEGKTSTLANLGTVFAQAGERVVLVSCDLRRPRLGQFFGINEQLGLTTVLLGEKSLGEVLQPVPGQDSLWILAAGPRPPNPAELLNGLGARDVFAALREEFDLVLVDSPPLLPVTDAVVLSKHVDAALIVLAAGQTRQADLQRATEKLTQVEAPVSGLVLNQVTRQNAYANGYGYSYSHGEQEGSNRAGGFRHANAKKTAVAASPPDDTSEWRPKVH
jgi:capsular exopolysaccharide synthesis family protein